MEGVGDPPPPPVPPPPIGDTNKRRAKNIENDNKSFKNNNGQPIKNTNTNKIISSQTTDKMDTEYNYNSLNDGNVLYTPNHPGPFYVIVSSETPISSRRKNCELHLYIRLKQINLTNYACKCVGYNTFRMTFNNFESANLFATNPNLKTVGLKAYIPERFVQRFYIIKNVPTCLSANIIKDEIMQNNECMEVVSIYRFTRKNDSGLIVPTETIKIGIIFDGIPTKIYMCGTKITPDLYVPPVRLCLNCGRLGHIALRCRSTKKCLNCGKDILCATNCSKENRCLDCRSTTTCKELCMSPRCILCNKIDHLATDSKNCLKWKSERNISSIMALTNLSRREILQNYPETRNRFQILSERDFNNEFPPLLTNRTPKINIHDAINKKITSIKYSKVAAPITKNQHAIASPIHVNPTKAVFDHQNFSKVTEIERALASFSRQMSTILTSLNCTEGLDVLKKFQQIVIPASANNQSPYTSEANEESQLVTS